MSKHTPGPWKIDDRFGICHIVTDRETKQKDIASILEPGFSGSGTKTGRYPSKMFNACLIAAAPEMLKFMKEIQDAHSCEEFLYAGTSSCALCYLIAKAEGK